MFFILQNRFSMFELLIDKAIGDDFMKNSSEITARFVRDSFSKIPDNENKIRLTIDSPGGDVFEGIAIFNIIRDFARNHPDIEIETYIQGMAASMASVIALAANSVNSEKNKIIVENNSAFMIHNAWGVVIGNANDMKDAADWFGKIDGLIRATYTKRTGKNETEIRKLMNDETWFFGNEIFESGFCDYVEEMDNEVNKNDWLTAAKAKVCSTQNKLREKTLNAQRKFDYSAAASTLGFNLDKTVGGPTVQDKTDGGKNLPDGKKGGCMTAEEFKKDNPEAYAQIVEEGKKLGEEAAQARATRLLQLGEKAGAVNAAIQCFREGKDTNDPEVVDYLFDRGKAEQILALQREDEKEIPDLHNLPKNTLDDSEEMFGGFNNAVGGR